jgi:hypothetical protein
MGRCSSSTWQPHISTTRARHCIPAYWEDNTYQELSGDEDDDTAALEGGLGIKCGNDVLNLLEGEALE